MAPAVRLLLVPGVCLLAALAVEGLGPRLRRLSVGMASVAVGVTLVLLVSVAGEVQGTGVIQRAWPALVHGVPLSIRADGTGITCALLAAVAAAVGMRTAGPGHAARAGLLLALAGTVTACVADSLVLVAAGLQLADVGVLLLVLGAGLDVRRAAAVVALHQLGALALLGAAVTVVAGTGGTLSGLNPGALSGGAAAAWAAAGAVRLLAAPALAHGRAAAAGGTAVAVAAVPGGLVALLRLLSLPGGGPPTAVLVLLGVAGGLTALAGAVVAAARPDLPGTAGRALLAALGGQVTLGLAVGGRATATAAAAAAVALAAAALAAAGWRRPGFAGAGALLAAAGLPFGAATAGLVLLTGAETAAGPPRSLVAGVAIVAAAVAAVAGARAAARALRAGDAPGSRLRSVLPLVPGAVLAFLPGVLVGGIADRIVDARGTLDAVDALSVRGPGGTWAGGYLLLALAAGATVAWAVATLAGRRLVTATGGGTPAAEVRAPSLPRAPAPLRRLPALAARVDRWLVAQPDLPAVCAVAVLIGLVLAVRR